MTWIQLTQQKLISFGEVHVHLHARCLITQTLTHSLTRSLTLCAMCTYMLPVQLYRCLYRKARCIRKVPKVATRELTRVLFGPLRAGRPSTREDGSVDCPL